MSHLPRLLLTVFVLTGLADAGCAEQEKASAPVPSASVAAPPPARADPDTARWKDLESHSYEQRDLLLAGLKPLLARVDEQIGLLKAKRAMMVKNKVDTSDWDFAMKEMSNARSYLAGMTEALGKARRDNWNEQKERFGHAWERTQTAYSNVMASTTS
jgi:hypothetical protein